MTAIWKPNHCTCPKCKPGDVAPSTWPSGVPFASDLWPRGEASAVVVSPLLCTPEDVEAAKLDAGAVLREQMEEAARRAREDWEKFIATEDESIEEERGYWV